MYIHLLNAMKEEGVTFKQIGSLLNCRYQTVSNAANGVTKKGFYYEDACRIQEIFFPAYDLRGLFLRTGFQ